MFNKILVALDRSPEASEVFDFALSVAQPEASEILLVHFVDWQMQDASSWIGIGTMYDVDVSREQYELSRQRLQMEVETSKDWLETLTQKAKTLDISCKYECLVGNCNLGIGDRAKHWDADLIVIGRRGYRNIAEMFLGSVSNYVIHHAPCSVLVVQGSETDELADVSSSEFGVRGTLPERN